MGADRTPRMTIPTQLVLRLLLEDPTRELYGVEIGDGTGLPSGTVHPILARLEGRGWLDSRWEEIDPTVEGRPARRYYWLTADGVASGAAGAGRRVPGEARPTPTGPSDRRPAVSSQRPQPPGRWPSRAIRLAVRALPPGPTRDRYRYEFLAELYGMSSTRQMRHAATCSVDHFSCVPRSIASANPRPWSSSCPSLRPASACCAGSRAPQMGAPTQPGPGGLLCSASTAARISTTSSDLPGRISEVTSLASVAESDSRKDSGRPRDR